MIFLPKCRNNKNYYKIYMYEWNFNIYFKSRTYSRRLNTGNQPSFHLLNLMPRTHQTDLPGILKFSCEASLYWSSNSLNGLIQSKRPISPYKFNISAKLQSARLSFKYRGEETSRFTLPCSIINSNDLRMNFTYYFELDNSVRT